MEIRKYSWFRGTNTGSGTALFSIKNKKFIKPPEIYWGANTTFNYTLLPGKYLKLEWEYWSKKEPSHTIVAKVIKIDEKGEECIAAAEWRVSKNYVFANPILRDFFDARPEYHCRPNINFTKVYDEKDVQELLQLTQQGFTFTEGQETE
ncbi:MAG: hypothetical protein ACPL3B_05580 [Fervidobacterium sp.]